MRLRDRAHCDEANRAHGRNGRRVIRADVGALGTVTVLASAASCLTEPEWCRIREARSAYALMWGATDGMHAIDEDPFDGRGEFARLYDTTHYIVDVTAPGVPTKTFCMRKVEINSQAGGADSGGQLVFDDIDFWVVSDRLTGVEYPLSAMLETRLLGWSPTQPRAAPAYLPVAALSRVAALPHDNTVRDVDSRNRSAVAFALMQIAAVERKDDIALYVGQICDEFRTKVFALQLANRSGIQLDFRSMGDYLDPEGDRYTVRLNRSHPSVRSLMKDFPGYWLDNEQLAQLIRRMVHEGSIRPRHLRQPAQQLLESPDVCHMSHEERLLLLRIHQEEDLAMEELERLARMFARARTAKYLRSLIDAHSGLWQRIQSEVGDGPYPIALEPKRYRASALRLLRAAKDMYAKEAGVC